MNNQIATINDLFKYTFGFSSLFNELDRLSRSAGASNFPPYNIIVDDHSDPSEYALELAVAGFSKDEITVKVKKEDGIDYLVIDGEKAERVDPQKYIVRTIATRSFHRAFSLSENAKVTDVKLMDGILRIIVKIERPEPQQVETVLQIQ